MIPMIICNMASGYVAIRHGLKGSNLCHVSACATGSHSIGEAARSIERGDMDVVVAGDCEAPITPVGVAGFAAMRALSTRNDEPQRSSRPFDRDRDGFVIAEGCGVMVLETLEKAQQRGATILAELAGAGMTCDAFHITSAHPDGVGAAQAMTAAMKSAGINPDQVDYINAHGTSTPVNDPIETRAIKLALGENALRVPVSSTKSMTGHAIGAAGALEAIICVKALQAGVMPPTINLENPDPDCDLDYVPLEARSKKLDVVMSNSFAFGGQNCVLVFRKFQ